MEEEKSIWTTMTKGRPVKRKMEREAFGKKAGKRGRRKRMALEMTRGGRQMGNKGKEDSR